MADIMLDIRKDRTPIIAGPHDNVFNGDVKIQLVIINYSIVYLVKSKKVALIYLMSIEVLENRETIGQTDDAIKQAVLHGLTGYINAGGRGVRLNSVLMPDPTLGISKALLPVGIPPVPLINHHINKLRTAGITTIVAGVGDHTNVADHVHEVYAGHASIHVIGVKEQLGNGGDLVCAVREHPEFFGNQVYISNVDTMLDIDEVSLVATHDANEADVTVALTLNRGVPNEGAYYIGENGQVIYCGEAVMNTLPRDEAVARCAFRGSSTGALVVEAKLLRDLSWSPEDGPL
ncbi:MAG: hypothetical protein WA843_05025, partial [Candidatus Saccharimonadales bacterium]